MCDGVCICLVHENAHLMHSPAVGWIQIHVASLFLGFIFYFYESLTVRRWKEGQRGGGRDQVIINPMRDTFKGRRTCFNALSQTGCWPPPIRDQLSCFSLPFVWKHWNMTWACARSLMLALLFITCPAVDSVKKKKTWKCSQRAKCRSLIHFQWLSKSTNWISSPSNTSLEAPQ